MASYKWESERHYFNYVRKILISKDLHFEFEDIIDLTNWLFFVNKHSMVFKSLGFRTPSEYFTYQLRQVDSFDDLENVIECVLSTVESVYDLIDNPSKEYIDNPGLLEIYKIPGFKIGKSIAFGRHIKVRSFSEDFEDFIISLLSSFGVYFLYDENRNLIYIGKSICLGSRIKSSGMERTAEFVSCIKTNTVSDMHVLEPYLISKMHPKLNAEFKTNDLPSFDIPVPVQSDLVKIFK